MLVHFSLSEVFCARSGFYYVVHRHRRRQSLTSKRYRQSQVGWAPPCPPTRAQTTISALQRPDGQGLPTLRNFEYQSKGRVIMSLRKLLSAFALASFLGAAYSACAIEIYTCKINPSRPAVGGLKSGVLSLASDVHPPHPMSSSSRIGECKGTKDWTAASNQKIPSAVFTARKGNVTEAWAATIIGPIGCICVTDPCPCAGGNSNSAALAKTATASPASSPTPQENAKLCPGHPSCPTLPTIPKE